MIKIAIRAIFLNSGHDVRNKRHREAQSKSSSLSSVISRVKREIERSNVSVYFRNFSVLSRIYVTIQNNFCMAIQDIKKMGNLN